MQLENLPDPLMHTSWTAYTSLLLIIPSTQHLFICLGQPIRPRTSPILSALLSAEHCRMLHLTAYNKTSGRQMLLACLTACLV